MAQSSSNSSQHLLLGGSAVMFRGRPCVGCGIQLTPPVAARLGGGEERVDRLELSFCCDWRDDIHGAPPFARGRLRRENGSFIGATRTPVLIFLKVAAR